MNQALYNLMQPEIDALIEKEIEAAREVAKAEHIEKMAQYLMEHNSSLSKTAAYAEAKNAME